MREKFYITALCLWIGGLSLILWLMGRPWLCECGMGLWTRDVVGGDNSRMLFDVYTFTHVQHGLMFFMVLGWGLRKVPVKTRYAIGLSLEAVWEMIENSPGMIASYATNTISQGYRGDTILNSIGDVIACAVGLLIARKLGAKKTAVLFVVIEIAMLITIRDSLILNIFMPHWPIESILKWQQGG